MRLVPVKALLAVTLLATAPAIAQTCQGTPATAGRQRVVVLVDGVVARAPLNINIDGSGRAYNRDNARGLIHLCNAGQVFPAGRAAYHGSVDGPTCTGRFMADLARIEAAGWTDGRVGAVRWYGIVGTGSAVVAGRTVKGVTPVPLPGGFFVSPTTLGDPAFPATDQRRYVEPLTIATAVVPSGGALSRFGVRPGTLGVALRRDTGIAVPFIVSDAGPRIGEGSPALARRLAGKAPKPDLTRAERFVGQVAGDGVTWLFLGGTPLPPPFTANRVEAAGAAAFARWGGIERLRRCG